jgi:hypothetical protein
VQSGLFRKTRFRERRSPFVATALREVGLVCPAFRVRTRFSPCERFSRRVGNLASHTFPGLQDLLVRASAVFLP